MSGRHRDSVLVRVVSLSILAAGCAMDRSGYAGLAGDVTPDAALGREAGAGPAEGGAEAGGPDARSDGATEDASFDAAREAGAGDTGGPADLGAPDSRAPDLGPPDLGPPDLGPPDLGPPDLGPPDPPDAGPRSCADIYGGLGGFILCVETPTECELYTRHGSGGTCASACAAYGGACIRRWRDADGAGNE
ncbi:MAG: hypothetical protein IT379_19485, partial [Deltaproteobacteria bacterium]|nr:hypothetical protein [Deltaproteobacteria bacterium]